MAGKGNISTQRPRITSPLYEDGPWIKDPFGPNIFRHTEVGTPGTNAVNETIRQKNAGGSGRKPEPTASISSVHKGKR